MQLSNVTYVSSTSDTTTTIADGTLDKDDFLQLLIAKLSNQDPLNPIDDESFVAELAQFSSLEQLSNMNESLTTDIQYNAILSQTISNTMATSLIGRTVRGDSSAVYLESGDTSDIAVNLDEAAQKVVLTITDENGNVVRTITANNLKAGDNVVKWDGTNDSGANVVSGTYYISAKAADADGNTFTPGLFLEGVVDGVVYENGIAYLSVNGMNVPLAAVQVVKEG